ncbi:MAG TPA: tRNA preQ1(34) S-adenosylmethionine ribosyltransferase-isomerase QueA [Gemmatimonadales bacterium]|nr:tRNA preQ1(34) S-adenosylmethionine ribosyltransferase-isomerase QueA [Gemmatimonadales bacterium]
MAADFRTADFDYHLPPELIAQEPVAERGASRMMVVRRTDGLTDRRTGAVLSTDIEDRTFAELPELIPPGDLLVLNDTRVRHARLLGMRPSGAPAEVLLLHPATDGDWVAIGKPGSALRPGKRITLGDGVEIETVEVLAEGYRRVRAIGADMEEAIRRFGRLPLPPYIHHDPTDLDEARYQTVYAREEGSVAAPTAGLHFTPAILSELEARGVELARVTLEVGPGTFKPVEDDDYTRHPMHPESYVVPEQAANQIAAARVRRARIWAVGTTVVRALESAADSSGVVHPGRAETRLMIAPGYRFKVVDALLTNFHLPRSTLLLLVAAFAGYDRIRAAYAHAVEQRYRFYSYGDAMVIL